MKIVIIISIFIIGLIFFCKNYSKENLIEGLNNKNSYKCPNMLIKKHNKIYLYNSQEARVPGVNPLQFNHLDEYTEFLEWQRSQNIRCPVLYLEKLYDTQNNSMWNIKANPFQQPDVIIPSLHLQRNMLEAGYNPITGTAPLNNAGYDDPPYNQNNYAAFDPYNQYIGLKTPLDKIFHEEGPISDNPMDPNWGGPKYTEKSIKSGKYKDNAVYIKIPTME